MKTFSDCQTIQQNPVLVETDKSKKRHLNCKRVLLASMPHGLLLKYDCGGAVLSLWDCHITLVLKSQLFE